MISYVAGLMFDAKRERVALIKKDHPAWQAGYYNAIGGKTQDGEYLQTAQAREFREETGVITHPGDWRHFLHLTNDHNWAVDFLTCATDDVLAVKLQEGETEVPKVFAVEFALDFLFMIPNLKWIIPMARDEDIRRATVLDRSDYSTSGPLKVAKALGGR